jgi:hypothetical protein
MKCLLTMFLALLLMPEIYGMAATNGGQDFFQAIGKIYVVVAVIAVIFVGLSFFLWKIDRKLVRLEKKHKIDE